MDEQLMALMECDRVSADSVPIDMHIRIADDACGQIELLRSEDDPSPQRYTLRPLSELYGRGNPKGAPDFSVDPKDDAYLPLFLAVEEEIVRTDNCEPALTDGGVELSLDLLASSPEADVHHDTLARRIQLSLRLLLSLNDYSRDEVRQVIRKIRKSVQRHTRAGGRRGYLEFIHQYIQV